MRLMEPDLRLWTLFPYSKHKTSQTAQILRLCQEGMQLGGREGAGEVRLKVPHAWPSLDALPLNFLGGRGG